MKLCIMMPALNEEATIADVIGRIPREIPEITEISVVVIDDGSVDGTKRLAEEAGARVIRHGRTRGVGAAFQAGLAEALKWDADFMVSMDSDGQFDPAHIPLLLQPLLNNEAGFVTASRFKEKELVPKMPLIKYWGNRFMSAVVSLLAGRKFYDVSCGFRAFSRDTLQQLNLFGHFTYTQETVLELSYKGVSIVEVPVPIRGTRQHGNSRMASNLFRYGWNTSKIIFRSVRDYRPMLVFGLIAGTLLTVALGHFIFLLYVYLSTGAFTPHKWAGFTGAFLTSMAFLVFITGLVADMLTHMRINQERMLYLLKRRDRP